MARILHVETATTNCSVSIAVDGKLVALKEENSASYSHSEQLHNFIEEALSSASLSFNQLDAIAVSMGPGSYTGLRIGVSTVKGLCFALDIPMIAISTLNVLAASITQEAVVVPLIDARRMEAYTAAFKAGKQIGDISAEIITEESFKAYWESDKTVLIGNCVEKCKTVLTHANIDFIEAVPSAKYMIGLAYQKYMAKEFVDVAYFEPYYLKDFVAGKPKKLL